MGIKIITPAKVMKTAVDKFVQLTSEVWKGFNRDARLYGASGDDSPPCKDDQIILVKIDGTGKYVAAGVLTVSRGAKPGEKILYARDADAEIVSKIAMLNDGSVTVEADGDITQTTKKNFNYSSDGDSVSETGGVSSEKIGGDKVIDAGGKVYIGGSADNICTLLIAGIDEIINLQTFGPPPAHKTHPSSINSLNAYKEKVKALFLESA